MALHVVYGSHDVFLRYLTYKLAMIHYWETSDAFVQKHFSCVKNIGLRGDADDIGSHMLCHHPIQVGHVVVLTTYMKTHVVIE